MNSAALPHARYAPTFRVLDVSVAAIQIPETIALLEEWIHKRGKPRYVAVTGMHGLTEAQHDSGFKLILNSAGLVVPDGMPLVWLGRLRGHKLARRVYGPELMVTFFESAARKGFRHFLYGGAPGIPERLAENLQKRFPGTIITGTYSPPYRALTGEEDSEAIKMVNDAKPDVIWVGLSTPKQERWMYEHRDIIQAPVMIGVGAAFDINAGMKKQAPQWMREHGFEWLFRLLQEPRRLWRRYLVNGSQFLFYVARDLIRPPHDRDKTA